MRWRMYAIVSVINAAMLIAIVRAMLRQVLAWTGAHGKND
jgi:hypothetical protein